MKSPRATRPVMLFEYEEDARRMMSVLPARFGKYGLTLHWPRRACPWGADAWRRPPRGRAASAGCRRDRAGMARSNTPSQAR
jgi:hypothetical protein